MKREKGFSYKTIFIFVFVVVLAAAIIAESNTAGALIIKREGIATTNTEYTNFCIDEDEGNPDYAHLATNAYIKQEVQGQSYTLRKSKDTCVSSSSLHEYYCIGNLIYGKTEYCAEGCANGACNPCLNCQEITATCIDSDGGKMFYLTGVVTDESGEHVDSCYGTEQGSYIREGYCSDGKFAWEWRQCPQECFKGACLKG